MKRTLLLLSPGFEELEAVAPLDLLRRAGIEVISASIGPELWVKGSHGIRIEADKKLDECLDGPYDMVILPGGPGVEGLRKDARVLDLVRRSEEAGVPLAAICAAPLVLADAGVVGDRTVTSFPGSKQALLGRVGGYSEARVVEDRSIITSRGAGSAEEFSLKLIGFLLGSEAAEKVRASIVAR
jgi:4-methyl-5(b-hydroxyethyl)-thiazole monophosphate biosynthesis